MSWDDEQQAKLDKLKRVRVDNLEGLNDRWPVSNLVDEITRLISERDTAREEVATLKEQRDENFSALVFERSQYRGLMNRHDVEVEKRKTEDANGNLIIEGARISHFLGSSSGVDRYVLEVPQGTPHQTGPYTMHKEKR